MGESLIFGAIASSRLDRMAEGHREVDHGSEKLDSDAAAGDAAPTPASVSGGAGLALLAAVTLDGVRRTWRWACRSARAAAASPSSPPSSSPTSPRHWSAAPPCAHRVARRRSSSAPGPVCAVLLTLAVVVGAGPLSNATAETLSLPLAFAAGAVLASLADTLMPEAYEHGGPTVALSTAAGFVLSFVLSTL